MGYYPFGMMMPGRKYSAGNEYRYGFNGQEKSNEVHTNSFTAEFWQYDSRLGRRQNLDPKPNPSISRYSTFANNPNWFVDIKGDTVELIIGKPYTDAAGESHPYGHAALRVFNAKDGYNMVYDFGRYGNVDLIPSTGEGILNIYKDGSKYIESETRIRSSVGYSQATTIEQDRRIIAHFAAQAAGGSVYKSGAVPNGGGTAYEIEEYDAFDNNCLTKTTEALSLIGVNWLSNGTYDPRDALKSMERRYVTLNLTRTEYNKGEEPRVTFKSKPVAPFDPTKFRVAPEPAKKDKTTVVKYYDYQKPKSKPKTTQ